MLCNEDILRENTFLASRMCEEEDFNLFDSSSIEANIKHNDHRINNFREVQNCMDEEYENYFVNWLFLIYIFLLLIPFHLW